MSTDRQPLKLLEVRLSSPVLISNANFSLDVSTGPKYGLAALDLVRNNTLKSKGVGLT